MATRSFAQRTAANFEAGSRQRWATRAKQIRSTRSPSMRRPLAVERSAWAMPEALPQLVEDEGATQPARVDDLDVGRRDRRHQSPAGSSTRLIERTSRASASLSTVSLRPKLWMTLATGMPVTGWRSLWANWR